MTSLPGHRDVGDWYGSMNVIINVRYMDDLGLYLLMNSPQMISKRSLHIAHHSQQYIVQFYEHCSEIIFTAPVM